MDGNTTSSRGSKFATKLFIIASRQYGSPFCGLSSKDDQTIDDVRFWVSGIAVALVGIPGLLWNVISFATIVTMRKKSLFHKLLLTLTSFDMLFLMTGGLFMVQQSIPFESSAFNVIFPKLIYPMAGISMTGSTYSCVAIALERYLGICFSQSHWYVRKSRFYVGAIIFLTLVIDGPRFLEIETTWDENGNVTGFAYTQLRNDKTYVTVYTLWFRLIATAVVPFCLMLCCNVGIIFYYRKNSFGITRSRPENRQAGSTGPPDSEASYLRSRMSIGNISAQQVGAPTANRNTFTASQERTLYVTFVCLTITFLLCHMPRIILNVYEVPMSKRRFLCSLLFKMPFYSPSWVLVMSSVEKLALIVNSSINFVFYCLVGKAFRQQMCKVVFRSFAPVIGMTLTVHSPLRHTLDYGHSVRRGDNAVGGTASVRGHLSVGQERGRKRSNVSFQSENTYNSHIIKASDDCKLSVEYAAPLGGAEEDKSPVSVRIHQTLIKGAAICSSCPNLTKEAANKRHYWRRSMTCANIGVDHNTFSATKSTSTLLGVFEITIVIESNGSDLIATTRTPV